MTSCLDELLTDARVDEKPASTVWLVAGASGGLGRVLAEQALRRGDRVVGTANRLGELSSLIEQYGAAMIPFELDVNDETADREIVERVVALFGRVDVVVNNAGYENGGSLSGPDPTLEQVQTNLFAALWISQAAQMYMRVQSGGCIVQTFARSRDLKSANRGRIERRRSVFHGFNEQLAQRVAPFDIRVTVCIPNELYNEWIETIPARTYGISRYEATWN